MKNLEIKTKVLKEFSVRLKVPVEIEATVWAEDSSEAQELALSQIRVEEYSNFTIGVEAEYNEIDNVGEVTQVQVENFSAYYLTIDEVVDNGNSMRLFAKEDMDWDDIVEVFQDEQELKEYYESIEGGEDESVVDDDDDDE